MQGVFIVVVAGGPRLGDMRAGATAAVVGDPLDEKTQLGPLAHEEQYRKVLDYLRIGQDEGATLRTGGKRPAGLP